jgi:hypothetical protein
VVTATIRNWGLDRLAMGLSGLCVVHCLATAVLVGLFATAGGLLQSAWIHEGGLALALVLGAVALGRGAMAHGMLLPVAIGSLGLGVMSGALALPHGGDEVVYTIVGVGLLAFGHSLNRLALA